KLVVAPPAIDPLSPKNRDVSESERKAILSRFEFDPTRPVISQVGRFDPWKDPLGVIDAYRLVKRSLPEVQLLMIGSMAKDDPEGWLWFERTARYAGDDPDIHFLTDLRGVGAPEGPNTTRGNGARGSGTGTAGVPDHTISAGPPTAIRQPGAPDVGNPTADVTRSAADHPLSPQTRKKAIPDDRIPRRGV